MPLRLQLWASLRQRGTESRFGPSRSISLRFLRVRLVHPDPPSNRPGLLIGYGESSKLQGELDLAVMVALVPDHVLQQDPRGAGDKKG